MTRIQQIEEQLRRLPLDKQDEVLDFVSTLLLQLPHAAQDRSLKQHPAFGSWANKNIDSVAYQRSLRAEWDNNA